MNITETLKEAERELAAAGVDTPAFDAKLLLAHAAGIAPRDVDMLRLLGRPLPESFDADAYHAMIARRAAREPLQHITGHAPFRYLDVEVGPGVFIPRPETETVVQAGIDWLAGRHIADPRIVDLCAGSGVIGLSAAVEVAGSEVWAVELSEPTHAWTERNRRRVVADHPDVGERYHLVLGDATAPETLRDLDGTIDLVISNPPYVPESEIPEQPEVRDHDPELALYGGSADGLRIPERIIDRAATLLRDGGALVMEHDISQGAALRAYAAARGFADPRTGDDLTGRPRYLFAVKAGI
ncbi:peptide chain release factor N(5)-glutamine methyltransferase [Bifidobacterium sp. 82T24]|uniref:peptide chain release factor N(5)-glutamine methyltransferase n=1 Tax=Bifidobacterium pluvialisilvae TaxID=2834436 RepID=UPI001C567687|nr:peptide chain release factor N(5)-glutamine methyltransferase [Bifidobacterium pluvialisilvae]MBW3088011.1 peptide chain release factor N(5)-glutamine methyltransferase [Bifidobacterium pluvialisilvae]